MAGKKGRSGGHRTPRPGRRLGRPTLAAPGNTHLVFASSYTLPCSIRKPTPADPDAICGKPASVASAWPQEPDGPWPTPGLWTMQPICRECAEAAAKIYEE